MFRKNEQHRQKTFFSAQGVLPPKQRRELLTSRAETFYQLVLCRVDETVFAGLYSDIPSRPNAAVNALVGWEILKAGYGWSDEELYLQLCFNLQIRHALGLHHLRSDVFTLRTVYNFRRRIRKYEEEAGINLMQKVFEQLSDEHLKIVELETG